MNSFLLNKNFDRGTMSIVSDQSAQHVEFQFLQIGVSVT